MDRRVVVFQQEDQKFVQQQNFDSRCPTILQNTTNSHQDVEVETKPMVSKNDDTTTENNDNSQQ